MARNPDPKHGRWILPLIIAAMVVLTFTFVNNIDPASDAAGTTTTVEPPFPTTPTSTTTTQPLALVDFSGLLQALEQQVSEFLDQATTINDDWETRSIDFAEARARFQALRDQIATWEQQIADTSSIPGEVTEPYVDFVIAAEALAPGIEDIIAGLEAPDDGTLRRQAVEQFQATVQAVSDELANLRSEAELRLGTPSSDSGTDA